jgi:hypothetical protein
VTTTGREYESVVEKVRRWPSELQFSLLHEVLHILAVDQVGRAERNSSDSGMGERTGHSTIARATGLLKTEESPPTDDEVRQLLQDRRIEKFG